MTEASVVPLTLNSFSHLVHLHELFVADPESEVLWLVGQEEDVGDEVVRVRPEDTWQREFQMLRHKKAKKSKANNNFAQGFSSQDQKQLKRYNWAETHDHTMLERNVLNVSVSLGLW